MGKLKQYLGVQVVRHYQSCKRFFDNLEMVQTNEMEITLFKGILHIFENVFYFILENCFTKTFVEHQYMELVIRLEVLVAYRDEIYNIQSDIKHIEKSFAVKTNTRSNQILNTFKNLLLLETTK